jgi:hypothetical protein
MPSEQILVVSCNKWHSEFRKAMLQPWTQCELGCPLVVPNTYPCLYYLCRQREKEPQINWWLFPGYCHGWPIPIGHLPRVCQFLKHLTTESVDALARPNALANWDIPRQIRYMHTVSVCLSNINFGNVYCALKVRSSRIYIIHLSRLY